MPTVAISEAWIASRQRRTGARLAMTVIPINASSVDFFASLAYSICDEHLALILEQYEHVDYYCYYRGHFGAVAHHGL